MNSLHNFLAKVNTYKTVTQNTLNYRAVWRENLKNEIKTVLNEMNKEGALEAKVVVNTDMENLESIVFNLGTEESGIFSIVNEKAKRPLLKHKGALIYQQLFNGKIMVQIHMPYIEGYGEPRPPKVVSIYRPEEITRPFIIRHMEEFFSDIINWEDFDDDDKHPQSRIGFSNQFQRSGDKIPSK